MASNNNINSIDYERMLRSGATFGGLESVSIEANVDLQSLKQYGEQSRSDLHRIVKEYFGNDKDLLKIADEIVSRGKSLHNLSEADRNVALEAIVRTDGSRPSFVIKDDNIDFDSSPVGMWREIFVSAEDELKQAIKAVGRIDMPGSPQGFQGTGFRIQKDLIMTNRHVLQAVAKIVSGKWQFHDGVKIDFGHEFRGRDSVSPRRLKSVVFSAKDEINGMALDHRKTDLVLIEIDEVEGGNNAPRLSIDVSTDWAQPLVGVAAIGYPGNPGFSAAAPPNLLEQLFQSTFGCKRIAPGEIMNPVRTLPPSTTSYDCTTLGGNSGSCIVLISRATVAAALHYGGTTADPRRNWGHVVGQILNRTDQFTNATLRECLDRRGVTLVDRRGANNNIA